MQGQTPPLPPRIPGRVALPLPRLIGTLVIVSIPVLALFGAFGDRWGHTSAAAGQFELSVRYPLRFRYKEVDQIELRVTNRAPEAITAQVEFSPSLLGGFTSVNFLPPIEKAYALQLANLPPGETGLVVVEIQAKSYGSQKGAVTVSAGGETLAAGLHIFVFP